MLRKRFTLTYVFLFFVLFSPDLSAKGPSDLESWGAVEKGTVQLLSRLAPHAPLHPTSSLEKRIQFYLDAGLWSSAEQVLKSAPPKEARPLLLALYLRRGEYDRIYAAYKGDPGLFRDQPPLVLAASQGALMRKAYPEALEMLHSLSNVKGYVPHRLYLTALAYWGMKDKIRFDAVLEKSMAWSRRHLGTAWSGRLHLLKVYYHLSRKETDLAFLSMGEVFQSNPDLALLGLGWGYFEHNSPDNLMSVLEGFSMGLEKSPYYGRLLQILSRFMIGQGDLSGAIEIDQRERAEIRRQIEELEKEVERNQEGGGTVPNSEPPGSLLRKTLLKLEEEVGERKEITALLSELDLLERQQQIVSLKKRERTLREEEERLRREIDRRCLSLGMIALKRERVDPLYVQARQAARQGQGQELEKNLKRLLEQGPHSPYFEESAFRLGDLSFNRGEYLQAVSYYQLLLDRPSSYLHRLAFYKAAWSHYLQGKPKEAIALLLRQREVIDPVQKGGAADPCRAAQAPHERREHLRLFALSLRAEGGPDRLVERIEGSSPDQAFSVFSELVKYYEAAGRREEMLRTVQTWVNTYPLYPKTPLLHQAAIDTFKRPGLVYTPEAVQNRVAFIENYRPESRWAAMNPEALPGIEPLLKNNLRFLMSHFRIEAKKGQKGGSYEKALAWHRLYFEMFPKGPETGEVHFLYGELLNEMKDPKGAAAAYRASAYESPFHPLASEAGYREIVLLEKIHPPSHPSIWEGYARFVKGFPSDRRTAQIYLKQAERAFQEEAYEKSRQLAQAVSFDDPEGCFDLAQQGCVMGVVAQRLIAQAYLKEGDYASAIDFLNHLIVKISEPALQIPKKELDQTHSLLVLAHFQQGAAFKLSGRKEHAADSYWEAYRLGGNIEFGAPALFEAASLWSASREWTRSEEAFLLFKKRYRASALYHPALVRLASLYEESGRLQEAADLYEEASRLRIETALSFQALGQTIQLYQTMEQWDKVILLAQRMSQQFQGEKEKEFEGRLIEAEARLKLGEEKTALKILSEIVHDAKPKERPKKGSEGEAVLFPVAKAHFLLAESEMKQYKEVRLVAPMQRNLERKKLLFNRLLQAYGKAAAAPSQLLALTANHRLGELFEEFSHALLKSERPQNLTADERRIYENLLKEQAYPYILKAQEAYQQNIEWGRRVGVENEWVVKSEERVRQIEGQIQSLAPKSEEVKG